MSSKMKRLRCLTAVLTSLTMLAGSAVTISAAPGETLGDKTDTGSVGVVDDYVIEDGYELRLEEYDQNGYQSYTGDALIFPASAAEGVDSTTEIEGKTGVYRWEKDGPGELTWTVAVPVDGLYNISLTYLSLADTGAVIRRGIMIDGKYPFSEASNVKFPRMYKDAAAPRVDGNGDEIKPSQVEVIGWQTEAARDNKGLYALPLAFYLSAGEHTITLTMMQEAIAVESLTLTAPLDIPTYEEALQEYESLGYQEATETFRIEAENRILYKTKSTIRMISDGDPSVTPLSRGNIKMNAIGGGLWSEGNDAIVWELDAPEEGLYKIALRVKQNFGDGLASYRQISVNGKIPYQEFVNYKFNYNKKWRLEELADENGEPFLVYLKEGYNELKMTVVSNENTNTEVISLLNECSTILSDTTLQIRKIIGVNPDLIYDYELTNRIPELNDNFDKIIALTTQCMDIIAGIGEGKNPSLYNQMKSNRKIIEEMQADPYRIPSKMDDLTTVMTSIGSWIQGLAQFPLTLDYLVAAAPDEELKQNNATIFDIFITSVVNFFNSFVKDYSGVAGVGDNDVPVTETIDVWLARGKDWGETLKNLADETFTPEFGIGVNVRILPAGQLDSGSVNSLMLAIASGTSPDVCLGVSSNSPGEFAVRNAVSDLSVMPGYGEVAQRFYAENLVPFTYQGGVYALPETLNFKVMFYRKDILSQYEIPLPNTWDEVYEKVIPLLNQNGMSFYAVNVKAVTDPYGLFEMFLYQNGGSLYNDDLTRSAMDTRAAYQAFNQTVELFTIHGVPETADFYNRFRTGESPIGIADFSTYMTLQVAAPELIGKWAIAPVPGTVQPAGSVDHSVGSLAAESCIILAASEHQSASWEFLQWWTSAETQTQYGNEIEAIHGEGARWATANREAFENIAWDQEDLAVMKQSFDNMKGVPMVLGGYYTPRHIGNAWNRVVINNTMSARDSLEKAYKDINAELIRRQEQYAK